MSSIADFEGQCADGDICQALTKLITSKEKDIGGLSVRRALPSIGMRAVGPFVFFDHMGPAQFKPGEGGIDVRPHPHIGLATVTYLYAGEFQHKDSLGVNQMIYPGELNWMAAGRGITHSERTSDRTRQSAHALDGIQTWVALPKTHETMAPSFTHVNKTDLPVFEKDGVKARLILGQACGQTAPVEVYSDMFYIDVQMRSGARFTLPDEYAERAVYVSKGRIAHNDRTYDQHQMLVFRAGAPVCIEALEPGTRLMALGGEPLDGPRYLRWNFVASDKAMLDQAVKDWQSENFTTGRFRLPPDDDQEFTPYP